MRNKLIAIVAASVLPLGFAASASATDPSAQHEVTFTVAEARSISVAVNGASNNTLDFGVIAATGSKTLNGAVTVTFSTPGSDFIRIQLQNPDTGDSAALPSSVTLSATALALTGGADGTPGVNVALGTDDLYKSFTKAHLLETFDVNFTLATTAATAATSTYRIQYELYN
jgi:hypothetical protein